MSEKGSSVQWENCVLPSAVRRGRVYNPCIMRIPSQVNSGRAATHTHTSSRASALPRKLFLRVQLRKALRL